MLNTRSFIIPSLVVLAVAMSEPVRGDLIFESATTLSTGPITTGGGGVETNASFYSGVNFHITSTTLITAIGGNFVNSFSTGNNQIFGAIVPVNGPDDTPSPPDLSSNVLGTTLITLNPGSLNIVSGDLNLILAPGWYAEIFGSGRFGATGAAVAVRTLNGQAANANGIATYALRQSDGLSILQAPGARYFVLGTTAVPEPSSFVLVASALPLGLGYWRLKRRRGGNDGGA